jgi:hypothetical protein
MIALYAIKCKRLLISSIKNALQTANYKGKRLVARTENMCKCAAGTHIFFGSATGPLDLALGTVPTRGGSV